MSDFPAGFVCIPTFQDVQVVAAVCEGSGIIYDIGIGNPLAGNYQNWTNS